MLKRHYRYLILLTCLISSCSQPPTHEAQGYIEGNYTYIATTVSGQIKELLVTEGNRVKSGDLLFKLDDQPESDIYQASAENLKQAMKAADSISANLEYARLTYERYQVLVPKKAIQQSQLDNAKAIYDATTADLAKSKANIAASTASLAEAKWRLDQKQVQAPVDGLIFDIYYRLGENTEANKAILSMLAPSDVKVIFYINADDLPTIRLKDQVTLQCDSCDKEYHATISFISPTAEYTPPVIYSTETRDKLLFRIEAIFDVADAKALHPGMPATVKYHPHG